MMKHIGSAICQKGTQLEKFKSEEFSRKPGLPCQGEGASVRRRKEKGSKIKEKQMNLPFYATLQ
jgi:hypothetical protein